MSKLSDEWCTPDWLFKELNDEFNFDVDLCATKESSKCQRFYSDYLKGEWYKKEYNSAGTVLDWSEIYRDEDFTNKIWERYPNLTCFMNPPYSNPHPFIKKAWEDAKYCKIVCLLPNTIKTCKYMDFLDENNGMKTFRAWKPGIIIHDLSRRTKFTNPHKKSSSPSFGCMVLIFDRRWL